MRTLLALLALLAALLMAGCDTARPTEPPLSDPREIAERAVTSTATLRAVHARIDLETAGEPAGFVVEGDVDLVSRHVSLVAGGNDEDSPDVAVIYVDKRLYTRSGDEPWRQDAGGDPLALVPPVPKIADAIVAALDDPEVELSLVGTEECGDMSCYHVTVLAPPGAVWRALGEIVPVDLDERPPAAMPALPLDFWVDRATLRLIQLRVSVRDGQARVAAILTLSRHDEPVFIEAPRDLAP